MFYKVFSLCSPLSYTKWVKYSFTIVLTFKWNLCMHYLVFLCGYCNKWETIINDVLRVKIISVKFLFLSRKDIEGEKRESSTVITLFRLCNS